MFTACFRCKHKSVIVGLSTGRGHFFHHRHIVQSIKETWQDGMVYWWGGLGWCEVSLICSLVWPFSEKSLQRIRFPRVDFRNANYRSEMVRVNLNAITDCRGLYSRGQLCFYYQELLVEQLLRPQTSAIMGLIAKMSCLHMYVNLCLLS